jgi:DNA-binding PadR family transcriptional regulator
MGGFGPPGGDVFGPGVGAAKLRFAARGGSGGRGRRGQRSRGDVRLAVLALLSEQPMHGYQIIQEITERTEGAWVPSPGSVYPTISQLADEGLLRTEKTDGRTVAQLTDHGQRHVAEHRAELDAVWTTAAAAADEEISELRSTGQGLLAAAAQVARTGTPEQLAEATRLLAETRRRLYLLLAGEAPADDETGAEE